MNGMVWVLGSNYYRLESIFLWNSLKVDYLRDSDEKKLGNLLYLSYFEGGLHNWRTRIKSWFGPTRQRLAFPYFRGVSGGIDAGEVGGDITSR